MCLTRPLIVTITRPFIFNIDPLTSWAQPINFHTPKIQFHPNVLNKTHHIPHWTTLCYCFEICVFRLCIHSSWTSWAQTRVSHIKYNSTLMCSTRHITFNIGLLSPDHIPPHKYKSTLMCLARPYSTLNHCMLSLPIFCHHNLQPKLSLKLLSPD